MSQIKYLNLILLIKQASIMKEDVYGVGIIPEDQCVGKLYFHEIE